MSLHGNNGDVSSSRGRSPNPQAFDLTEPDLIFLWRVAAPAGAPETHLSASTNYANLFATRVSSITIVEIHESLGGGKFKEMTGDLSELPGMAFMDVGTWEEVNAFLVRVATRAVAKRPTSGIVTLGKLKLKAKMT